MHNCFLSDLHSILENTKPNTAEYDSAVTDLADTVYTSCDYEDVLARMERLFIHEGESKNNQVTFTGFYLLGSVRPELTSCPVIFTNCKIFAPLLD